MVFYKEDIHPLHAFLKFKNKISTVVFLLATVKLVKKILKNSEESIWISFNLESSKVIYIYKLFQIQNWFSCFLSIKYQNKTEI